MVSEHEFEKIRKLESGNIGINGSDEIVDDVILYNNFASLRKKVFVKERVMTMAKPIPNRKVTLASASSTTI